VRVTAAPVVPLDLLCASGRSYFGVPATPYVPGVQGVGEVVSSERYDAGSRVWFSSSAGMGPGDGSMGELCLVPDADVVPLEDDVPDAVAAAVGLSGVAAWMMLTWRAPLKGGQRVLVNGGGGAVGQSAIGVARLLGASSVVSVVHSGPSRERAAAAGAEVVVDLGDDVDALTTALGEHGPFDVVIDPVWGMAATAASRVLAEGGRLVNLGGAGGDDAVLSSAALRSRSASVLGYTNNALSPDERRAAVTAVFAHAAAGRVRVAHETHALEQVEQVWGRQGTPETPARSVLLP
jgi:NADPH:quinone reductase-like Zn-dependent oxidoreductase